MAISSEVHRRAIIVDGHCDTPYRLLRHNLHIEEHDPEAQLDLRTLKESGITASFFAAYVPPFYAGRGAAAFAYKLIDLIHEEARRKPEVLDLVTDAAGIRRVKREGRIALMIGVEGGHAIEDSLDILRDFYAKGARYATSTRRAPVT
jgi:membrane dipeptidase